MLYSISNNRLLSFIYQEMATEFESDKSLVGCTRKMCDCWKKYMGFFETDLQLTQDNVLEDKAASLSTEKIAASRVVAMIASATLALPGAALIHLAAFFVEDFQKGYVHKQKMIFNSQVFFSAILALPYLIENFKKNSHFEICQKILESVVNEDCKAMLAENFTYTSAILHLWQDSLYDQYNSSKTARIQFSDLILKTTMQLPHEDFVLPQVIEHSTTDFYKKIENLLCLMPVIDPWKYHSSFFKEILWRIYRDGESSIFYKIFGLATQEIREILYHEYRGGVDAFINDLFKHLALDNPAELNQICLELYRIYPDKIVRSLSIDSLDKELSKNKSSAKAILSKLFLEMDSDYPAGTNDQFSTLCTTKTSEELCFLIELFTPRRRLELYSFLSKEQKDAFVLKLLEQGTSGHAIFISEMARAHYFCSQEAALSLLELFREVFDKVSKSAESIRSDSESRLKRLAETFDSSIHFITESSSYHIFNAIADYRYTPHRTFSQFILKTKNVQKDFLRSNIRIIALFKYKQCGFFERFEIFLEDVKQAAGDESENLFLQMIFSILNSGNARHLYREMFLVSSKLILSIVLDKNYIHQKSSLDLLYKRIFSKKVSEVIHLFVASNASPRYINFYFQYLKDCYQPYLESPCQSYVEEFYRKLLRVMIIFPNFPVTIAQNMNPPERKSLEDILNKEIASRQVYIDNIPVTLSASIEEYENEPLAIRLDADIFRKKEKNWPLPEHVKQFLKKYEHVLVLQDVQTQKEHLENLKMKLNSPPNFHLSLKKLCADEVGKLYPQNFLNLDIPEDLKQFLKNNCNVLSKSWNQETVPESSMLDCFLTSAVIDGTLCKGDDSFFYSRRN